MEKTKICLYTIRTKAKYIQLGLFNLKAYINKYWQSKPLPIIKIHVFTPKTYTFHQGMELPYVNGEEIQNMAQLVLKEKAPIIGFSCFVWNINPVLKLVKIIKKRNPNTLIILGGPEASDYCNKILTEEEAVDFIVRDEGEASFYELLEYLITGKKSVSKIKGISFRYNRQMVHNLDRPPLDLTQVPSPYLENLVHLKKDNKVIIETSRGCPFRCAYCSFSIKSNNRLRFFPINKVKKEIAQILKKNIKHIWINDDNFNIHRERVIKILKFIAAKKKNKKIEVFLNASMWPLDKKLVQLLADLKIHCMIGIQSVNKNTLKLVDRIDKKKILESNLKLLDQKNTKYSLEFIVGLPGDTYQDIKADIDWALSFNPVGIVFFPLMITPRTALYQNIEKYNIVYNRQPPYITYKTGTMSRYYFQKSLYLVRTLILFYNRLFLKKSFFYLNEEFGIKFSDMLELWLRWNKLFIKEKKTILTLQNNFIKYLLHKFQISTVWQDIQPLIMEDFISFCDKNKIIY